MKRLFGLLAALLFLTAAPAFASPLPYINSPMDTPQGLVNQVVTSINANQPEASYITACSGTTTSTCQGTRLNVSVTGLTTAAAGVSSAAMTVTDASVAANSQIFCQVNGYAGTGNPITALVVPAAGSFTFVITNVASSGVLNATVVSSCLVFN